MALQPGNTLNSRYLIIRLLGQGGMGSVYLAEDLNLGRKQVAIKENLDFSQAAQDQFRAEALILARLSHPGLPQVTDHFVLPSGAQYLVMQYIEGEDLEQILARRRPLPERDVLDWMAQVLEALQYMHTWVDPATGQVTPVVHRDIKPANIKRTPGGRIMLVDFGIAKYQQAGGTKTGARAASPGFSPVEQYAGGTDVRSDVYSAGATLYSLLTGQVPPPAPDLAAGRVQLTPPRVLVPSISGNTSAVIQRAMQPWMADRYQSIAEFAAALLPGLWQACHQCGTLNRAGTSFCRTCGKPLGTGSGPASPRNPPRVGSRPALMIVAATTAVVVLAVFGNSRLAPWRDQPRGMAAITLTVTPTRTRIATFTPTPWATRTRFPTTTPTHTPVPTETQTITPTPTITRTPLSPPPDMVVVPAGAFQMGCDPDHIAGFGCQPDQVPLHRVYLDTYWIDKTEVSNAQYARCVEARSCTPPRDNSSETRPSYYGDPQYADYPVIWVNWEQAAAYCRWANRRLPSEAEWEKAARGAADTRVYPWGDQPANLSFANFRASAGAAAAQDVMRVADLSGGTSPYGLLNMAGNVWEWVNDSYAAGYYRESPESNPTGPASGDLKVIRGGAWYDLADKLTVAYRNTSPSQDAYHGFGFRCAASPGQ